MKKRAKKPPAAAKDMSKEMIMALAVAAKKKSIKTSNPVKDRKVMVPTEMTKRARKGLPLRVHRRSLVVEFLEASLIDGPFSERATLSRWIREWGADVEGSGKKTEEKRRWSTERSVSSSC